MTRIEEPLAGDLDEILTMAGGKLLKLRGASVFITGGTGFWGRWLLESLFHANRELELGIKVVVLSRSPGKFLKKSPRLFSDGTFKLVKGDVRDFDFSGSKFTDIFHCATPASARLNAEDPLEMFDTIVSGTRRVLEFAVKSGARRILLASSGAIYGRQPPELSHITEDFRGGPDPASTGSAYAEGKRAAEQMCVSFQKKYGIEMKIARGFAFVGPFLPLDIHYAIGNFLNDALAGNPIVIKGDGTPLRSYMYPTDLINWLITIITEGKPGIPYNVGSDRAVSISETAGIVAGFFDPKPEIKILGKPVTGVLPERYVPSMKKAVAELGLKVKVELEEAVKRTVEFNKNPGRVE